MWVIMGKSSTTFDKDNRPIRGRGKSFKSKLLDVIREESLIGATPKTSKEDAERIYLTHFAKRAFDVDDSASPTLSKELLNKSYPSLKSTMPLVEFDFNIESTPVQQANQILDAASKGLIPPDVAQVFITTIASMMRIEEITDISNRLSDIEKALKIDA